jgi:hypothetical protein
MNPIGPEAIAVLEGRHADPFSDLGLPNDNGFPIPLLAAAFLVGEA